MRRILILCVVILSPMIHAVAQEAESKGKGAESVSRGELMGTLYGMNREIFLKAKKYNDMDVAKDALYRMVTMDSKNDSLLFQLGYLYYEQGQFFSSVFVMNDVLALNPDNLAALELSASSYQRLGALEKAAEAYENLYLKNSDLNVLYRLSFVQYDLKRYAEAQANISIILKDPKSKEIKLLFEGQDKKSIEVPMNAVMMNLEGLIEQKKGNVSKAKELFQKALEVAPDFPSPKEELSKLK